MLGNLLLQKQGIASGLDAQFSVKPAIGIVGDRQILKCDITSPIPNSLNDFHIFKVSNNPVDLPVEYVKVTQDGVSWGANVSSDVKSRGQIFGSVQTFPYFIELILSHAKCEDAGDYSCLASAPKSPTIDSHQNLKLNSLPGVPILTLNDHTPKSVGEEINVTCTGLVGQPPEPFLWLRSINSTVEFVEFTPIWPSKIINPAPIYDASICQNTRTSVLTYVIEKEDIELRFKCKVSSTLESVPTTHEATVRIDTSGIVNIGTTIPMIVATTQEIKSVGHSDACFNDFFGMYTEHNNKFIYCRGLSNKENTFKLAKYVGGQRQSIVEISHNWQFSWSDHELEARTTLMKIEDRNPGVLLRFDQPQCDDNVVYRCEANQFGQLPSDDFSQIAQKNFTIYIGDFTAKVAVDQTLSNPNAVHSGQMPVYAVKTKVLIHLTCTAHVPAIPATIEWHRYRKVPPSAILWDKNDFGQSAHSVSGCDYEISNQLPYYVTDGDVGDVDFECIVISKGIKNSRRVSFAVEGPVVTTTPAPTTIGHQIHEANGIRVTVTPPHPIIHQEMTFRCDDIQVTPTTLYFIRLSKTDKTGTKTVAAVDSRGASNVIGGTRVTVTGSLQPNPFLELKLKDVQITDGGTYRCSVGELLESRFIDTIVTLST